MQNTVLPIAYFPPISWFMALLKDNAVIEQHENYVKQTIRNRCQIATANGIQRLSLPVIAKSKPQTADVLIAPHDNWQQKQWNAISTAYGESAFFDYYADDLKPFFTPSIISQHPLISSSLSHSEQSNCSASNSLFTHNLAIIKKLLELLDIDDCTLRFTDSFVGENYTPTLKSVSLPPYYQVFREKTGFLPNLSILDLLFNLGPEAACYLLKK